METETLLAISAGATFALALVATAAIVVNVLIRNKDIDREHKARSLREIREWAKAGVELFAEYQRPKNSFDRAKWLACTQSLWEEKDSIVMAAENFGGLLALAVKDAASKLDDFSTTIYEQYSGAAKKAEECQGALATVYRFAAEFKARLKL